MPKGKYERTPKMREKMRWTPERRALLVEKFRAAWTPERKAAVKKGEENHNFGRKQTARSSEKKRAWMLENAPNRGKPMPDETKVQLREARQRQGSPLLARYGITPEIEHEARAQGLRWCGKECKTFLPAAEFSPKGKYCRKCQATAMHQWKNRAVFGLSPADYQRMVIEQRGLCAICGQPQSPAHVRLCLDHDHQTGKPRGLLCRQCNFGVERLDDIPDWMTKALAYLARFN